MSNPLQLAFAELGTQEIKGSSHNNRIINYALESSISGIETDETPWCSVFVNWVCHKTGKAKSGKPNARSWVNVGGESGYNPRPMNAEWILDIKEQYEKSDVAFFFKQWRGKNKKKDGQILNGRNYDEYPK